MLSDQQIDHFETFGFLFLPRLFPPAEIAEIRLAADALVEAKSAAAVRTRANTSMSRPSSNRAEISPASSKTTAST